MGKQNEKFTENRDMYIIIYINFRKYSHVPLCCQNYYGDVA